MVYLKSKGIYAVATLRSDRSRGCPIPAEKEMKKEGRGCIFQFTDTKAGLVLCCWYDNRRVITISNFLGKDPISEANHFDRVKKQKISVPSVELYNQYMGGVDKADMYLALYRTKLRTRKWYHRLAFHFMSMAVINSYIVYREVDGQGSLLDFLTDICRCLASSGETNSSDEMISDEEGVVKKMRSFKASYVPHAIRFDKRSHWPLQCEMPQRCKHNNCTRRTRFLCSKCQVYLCVTGTECFLNFHGVASST